MKKEKPRDTKAAIIETALSLVWSQSYGAVSVDDICQAADAKKGSFYHYFGSKAELACVVLEHLWEEIRPDMDRIFSPQNKPLDRLKLYTDSTMSQQVEMKKQMGHVVGCPFTSLASEQCSCDDGIRVKASEILKRVQRYITSTLREAMNEGSIPEADAEDLALKLLNYELGALSYARVSGNLAPIEGMHEIWMRMIQANAGKQKAA